MKYSFERSYEILERTPVVLKVLLTGLDDEWVMNNEGPETFSPYDVVGHLIHGEKTDWRDRTNMILEHGVSKTFVPYDRFAQNEESKGKTLQQLLNEFEALRMKNMEWFKSLDLSETDLDKEGIHPVLGQVTRVMAKQYKEEMGPWLEFFRIMSF